MSLPNGPHPSLSPRRGPFHLPVLAPIWLLAFLLTAYSSAAQEESDAARLRQLSYMRLADRVDCSATTGSNLETRICWNLKFQRVDSILHVRWAHYLAEQTSDSLAAEARAYQEAWIGHRRRQSAGYAEGYRGHLLGIRYLASMVQLTEWRIQELEFYLEEEFGDH